MLAELMALAKPAKVLSVKVDRSNSCAAPLPTAIWMLPESVSVEFEMRVEIAAGILQVDAAQQLLLQKRQRGRTKQRLGISRAVVAFLGLHGADERVVVGDHGVDGALHAGIVVADHDLDTDGVSA